MFLRLFFCSMFVLFDFCGFFFSAIDSCRQQLSGVSTASSEHTSSDGPVLEEFIPIKKVSAKSNSENEEDEQSKPEKIEVGRLDWLKSAQLWNQSPDPPVTEVKFRHHYSVFSLFGNRENGREISRKVV